MDRQGIIGPAGSRELRRTRDLGDLGLRHAPTLWWRLQNLPNRLRGLPADAASRFLGSLTGAVTLRSQLSGVLYRRDVSLPIEIARRLQQLLAENADPREVMRYFGGSCTEYGILSTRVVTDTGVAFIVDALHASATIANLKFHGFGTGTTAEAQGDTALVTELTTQYAIDNTRPTGTQTETSANVYSTVATLTPDTGGALSITEHGVFDQAATGGGTLLDRSKFTAVPVTAGTDSFQITYNLTLAAGG